MVKDTWNSRLFLHNRIGGKNCETRGRDDWSVRSGSIISRIRHCSTQITSGIRVSHKKGLNLKHVEIGSIGVGYSLLVPDLGLAIH